MFVEYCILDLRPRATRSVLLGSNHMEFDKDNSHLLQLFVEMHKKLQTSKLEFGLNRKRFKLDILPLLEFQYLLLAMIEPS